MSGVPIFVVFLLCIVGFSQVAVAKKDPFPGRRVGGGTRHEVPPPSFQAVNRAEFLHPSLQSSDRNPPEQSTQKTSNPRHRSL